MLYPMFTGIVERSVRVASVSDGTGFRRLNLAADLPDAKRGESVAVNGVCLTVAARPPGELGFDVVQETLNKTNLKLIQAGDEVQLERSLRVGDRIDGHFVQGHVDGVGVITNVRAEAESHWLTIDFPASLSAFLIRKGSIAVDGISLTVAGLGDGAFDVMVIPYTWDHTTLRHRRPQDKVNLECDMIGKYVVRAIDRRRT
jgi:riboflavin synthase